MKTAEQQAEEYVLEKFGIHRRLDCDEANDAFIDGYNAGKANRDEYFKDKRLLEVSNYASEFKENQMVVSLSDALHLMNTACPKWVDVGKEPEIGQEITFLTKDNVLSSAIYYRGFFDFLVKNKCNAKYWLPSCFLSAPSI